jgi:hypothetical protein
MQNVKCEATDPSHSRDPDLRSWGQIPPEFACQTLSNGESSVLISADVDAFVFQAPVETSGPEALPLISTV